MVSWPTLGKTATNPVDGESVSDAFKNSVGGAG